MKTSKNFMPIYYQLAEDLKARIESGELKPGVAIPSESQLVNQYETSRVTVRRGLARLLAAGLIQTVRGKGNFVARPKLNQMTLTFNEADYAKENQLSYKLIEVKSLRADQKMTSTIDIPEGTKMFMVKRLIRGKKGPVGIDIKYIPYLKGKPILENEIEYADFPEFVAKHTDVMIHKIQMKISAAPLREEEAGLLSAAIGHPTLTVMQVVYAKNEKLLGFSRTAYLGESFELNAVAYPYAGEE